METSLIPLRRGRGRPPSKGETKMISMNIRVTPSFREKFERSRQRSGRSGASEAEHLIEMGMMFELMLELGHKALTESDM